MVATLSLLAILAGCSNSGSQSTLDEVVTHEIRFARSVTDQVLFMDGGVILEHGAPEAVLVDPQQARTRTFLHRILDPI